MMILTSLVVFLKTDAGMGKLAHLGGALVIVPMCWTPGLEAPPAEVVTAFQTFHTTKNE